MYILAAYVIGVNGVAAWTLKEKHIFFFALEFSMRMKRINDVPAVFVLQRHSSNLFISDSNQQKKISRFFLLFSFRFHDDGSRSSSTRQSGVSDSNQDTNN